MDQTELMCAMYSDPDTVKAALDQVTSVLIEYVSCYIKAIGADKIIGNLWPYIIFPAEYGVCITQDYMPLLEPEQYEEVEIPRLKRIADTFGGVFIHCCGEYERHFAALRLSGIKIRGMEQHYPCTKIWNQYEVFGDSMFYVPLVIPNNEYRSMADFCKSMSERHCAKTRLWFSTSGEAFDADLAKLLNPSESERSRTII